MQNMHCIVNAKTAKILFIRYLVFYDICRDDFTIVADMVTGLYSVKLTGNLFVKQIRFLFLTVEHAALQGQGQLLNSL